ncbi:MAG: PSP1 C-terminal conserved region-domain-containing protein [Linnemannia elongata]|nr:MAG: PSP1 C-terminal conserved region-domain-containing protein [Linnemannia elongata]
MSFSEPSFSNAFGLGTTKSGYDQDDEDVLRYRPPLATMDEELEDPMEAPRMARTRSFSTSAALGSSVFSGGLSTPLFSGSGTQDPFSVSTGPLGGSSLAMGSDAVSQLNRRLSGAGVAWPSSSGPDILPLNRRRSITSTSGYSVPIWESSGPFQPLSPTSERERQQNRQLISRRFSVAPSSGLQNYDAFLDEAESGSHSALGNFSRLDFQPRLQQLCGSPSTGHLLTSFWACVFRYPHDADAIQQSPRRHSVAVPGGSYLRPKSTSFDLTSSFDGLRLDESERNSGHGWSANDGLLEEDEYQGDVGNTKDLGKGLSLGQLPHRGSLYMVEFKAGRSDLFYTSENSGLSLKTGDLVMVEADRGKDLGKITNDYITPQQIQALQARQAENAALQAQQDGGNGGHRAPKEIHPKRIFGLAQSSEIAQLVSKNQDEIEAMIMCQTKVRQKRLPMEVVNAEYQWDRRKLTFYFTAEKRIDFRELVRDLFKMYKTRIWMYALSPSMANNTNTGLQSSSPPPTPTAHQHPHHHHQQQRQHHITRHQVNSAGGISSPTSPRSVPTPKTPSSPYYASPYGHHYPEQPSYSQYPQIPTGFQPQQHQQSRQHHMPTQFSAQQVFSPHSHYQHRQQHHHFSFAPPTSP